MRIPAAVCAASCLAAYYVGLAGPEALVSPALLLLSLALRGTARLVLAYCAGVSSAAAEGPLALVLVLPAALCTMHNAVRERAAGRGASIGWIGPTSLAIAAASTALAPLLALVSTWLPAALAVYALYAVASSKAALGRLGRVGISVPPRLELVRGERRPLEIKVENPLDAGVWLSVSVSGGDGYRVSPCSSRAAVAPGSSARIDFDVSAVGIGSHGCRVEVSLGDVGGLAVLRRSLAVEIVVRPRLALLERIAYRLLEAAGAGAMEYGEQVSFQRFTLLNTDKVGEFVGCRDYLPGDSPRGIDIKKSVSRGKLIVREYEGSGPAAAYVLADLSVNTPEDLDTVLSGLIAVLIRMVMEGRLNVGVAMFNSSGYVCRIKPTSPLLALRKVLSMIGSVKPEPVQFKYDMSPPSVESLIESRSEYARAELEILARRLAGSIVHDAIRWIESQATTPVDIYLVWSGSRNAPIYSLVRYIESRKGHRVFFVPGERGYADLAPLPLPA